MERGIEDPEAEGVDESGLFRERNEAIGHYEAVLWVLPTDQGLYVGDVAGSETCLRLVVQQELVMLDGMA